MKETETRLCLWCDKKFIPVNKGQYYCKKKHRDMASYARKHPVRNLSIKFMKCGYCGKTFGHDCIATKRKQVGYIKTAWMNKL